MFRLAFLAAVILLVWVQSFFPTTTHTVNGNHYIITYGWVAWLFSASFVVLLFVFAWIAWRWKKDRIIFGIVLAGIPLVAFATLPQIIFERVEITDEILIHRREPPHTKYSCDIPFRDIAAVIKIRRETGSFSTYYAIGYRINTHDGQRFELPSGTVVTDAHETIDAALSARNIPIETETIRRPPPR